MSKNSVSDQNAGLLAGFSASATYFGAKQSGMSYYFSRARSGLRNREKEENGQF